MGEGVEGKKSQKRQNIAFEVRSDGESLKTDQTIEDLPSEKCVDPTNEKVMPRRQEFENHPQLQARQAWEAVSHFCTSRTCKHPPFHTTGLPKKNFLKNLK